MNGKIRRSEKSTVISGEKIWIGRASSESLGGTSHPATRLRDHSKDSHLRTSIGAEVPYQAFIDLGTRFAQTWRIRDISMSGAFVEMDIGEMREGVSVEFVFRFHRNGQPVEHRLPATIIRIQRNGVALAFGRYDDETYSDLVSLLY